MQEEYSEEFRQSAFNKLKELKNIISAKERMAVAFSAGVDSTFLLTVAHAVLKDNVLAVTAVLSSVPEKDISTARMFCHQNGITQLEVPFDELSIPGFSENPPERCYICKKALFSRMKEIASENGILCMAEGSNADDAEDYRPGLKALKELEIFSPLTEAGLSKSEIRFLSKEMELPTWDKRSAACLSSRIPYGETITKEKLHMIDRAEQLIKDLGFDVVRVRMHGEIARIETAPEEFEKMLREGIRERITQTLKELGFSYVTMDLTGYRTGSLNEVLNL